MLLTNVPMGAYVRDAFHDHGPSLSSGIAHVLLTQSPSHARYQHAKLNPDWAQEEDSRFDVGTAAHAILLEGARERIRVIEADDWRSKAARTARDLARLDGKVPLLARQAEAVMRMVAATECAMQRSPDLRGLGPLKAEQTMLWQDDGAWCRARPDWITEDLAVILSLKTTAASAEPDAFTRGVLLSRGYDVQAAFESRGVEFLTGTTPKYVWLVQETDPPYACSLLGPGPELMELGLAKYRAAITQWVDCVQRNVWPGYPERICWVTPPPWAVTQWTERSFQIAPPPPSARPSVDDGRPLADQLWGEYMKKHQHALIDEALALEDRARRITAAIEALIADLARERGIASDDKPMLRSPSGAS